MTFTVSVKPHEVNNSSNYVRKIEALAKKNGFFIKKNLYFVAPLEREMCSSLFSKRNCN